MDGIIKKEGRYSYLEIGEGTPRAGSGSGCAAHCCGGPRLAPRIAALPSARTGSAGSQGRRGRRTPRRTCAPGESVSSGRGGTGSAGADVRR